MKAKFKIVVAHLNINLICLIQQIMENIDILMILEIKLNSSFPAGQLQ